MPVSAGQATKGHERNADGVLDEWVVFNAVMRASDELRRSRVSPLFPIMPDRESEADAASIGFVSTVPTRSPSNSLRSETT